MEIIKIEDSRYDIYEDLLLERDALKKEAKSMLALYIHCFGELMTAVYRKKIDCISRKKAIAFCAMYANRGEPVDYNALQEYVITCTEKYRQQLANMIADNESCKNLRAIPESQVMEVKQIYRRIAKKMHPDINPVTENDPVFLELWQRIDIAYRCNDLREMQMLEILTAKALEQAGCGTIVIDIPDIDEKIDGVRAEIEKIRTTDPYMYKLLLDDEDACTEKENELKNELAEYEKYDDELKNILKTYVKNGVKITWETI